MIKQRTIAREVKVSGQGLHTGHVVNVVFRPAKSGEGIRFVRTDLPGRPEIALGTIDVVHGGEAGRYSALKTGDAMIYTVEHMLSALAGLGIDTVTIDMDGDEAPGMDGSARLYLQALKEAGLVDLEGEKKYFKIQEPITVSHNGASVTILPADDFRVSYSLEYAHPMLKGVATYSISPDIFESEIASCRTFCLLEEAEGIRAKGLGLGANHQNTMVFGPDGVVDNVLRFPDEPVRHKILDCVGDLYALGLPIKGHLIAFRSGHNLNRELLKKIFEQKIRYEAKRELVPVESKTESGMDVHGIMKVIPHRYPFLLVDRIIEMEPGKRAVGLKNVTMNEAFFQGHFPGKPVMPGVLMVEAMAQVAGVVALSMPELKGKLAFFMSVDGVKFRRVVEPGDQVVMEIEITRARARSGQARGTCKVNGELACEADMGFFFGDA